MKRILISALLLPWTISSELPSPSLSSVATASTSPMHAHLPPLPLAPDINNNFSTTLPSNDPPSTQSNASFVIDTFRNPIHNDLGYWHGPGEELPVEYGDGYVTLYPTDPDQNFHTQLAAAICFSLLPYRERYLHIIATGTTKFSVSLNQHNRECDPHRNPYPENWDTVEAERYARMNEIYIPLEHFSIELSRAVSVSFHGFFTKQPLTLYKVEIVEGVPRGFPQPKKEPNGLMVLRCSRPNSFAFGIDDGQPQFAQEMMRILDEEGIVVTFFVVANGLKDADTNFSGVYREMLNRGHQIALHSNSHPKMEGLKSIEEIDAEITKSIRTFKEELGVESRYFRPPFGTVGARMRQRLAALIHNPFIVNWSVDVEDWLWADTDTPEKQLEAFVRHVGRGGNLAVMHYLSPSTVKYFRELIHFVKAIGFNIMRVDQCIDDPDSPPLKERSSYATL